MRNSPWFLTILVTGALHAAALLTGCSGSETTAPIVGTANGGDASGGDAGVSSDATGRTSSDTIGDMMSSTDAAGNAPVDAVTDSAGVKYPLCSQALTCLAVACSGQAEPNCADPCLAGTSASVKSALQPYLTCVDQYCAKGLCAGSSDPNCFGQCALQKCLGKAIGCGADGKVGPGECGALLTCLNACQGKGLDCSSACYGATTAAGQKQFDQLIDCAVAAGGPDPFASCPTQALQCVSGGKTGTGTCADLWMCAAACEQLPEAQRFACYGQCWGSASSGAQQDWMPVAACFNQMGTGCGAAMTKCAAPTGSKTCLDTAGCIGTCDKLPEAKPGCAVQCLQAASPVEATKTGDLLGCIGAKCAFCKGQDPCQDNCMKTQCKAELTACLAP